MIVFWEDLWLIRGEFQGGGWVSQAKLALCGNGQFFWAVFGFSFFLVVSIVCDLLKLINGDTQAWFVD